MSGATIWKETLKFVQAQRVQLPRGSKILSVQAQNNRPTIWFQCDPAAPSEDREIFIVPTGETAPYPADFHYKFLGTVQLDDGSKVIHIFERPIA